MKVLLSAYACEPGRGSEPDLGFQTMLTLAEYHQVWVLTKQNNVPSLEAYLSSDPRASRITLVGLDLGPVVSRIKRQTHLGLLWYYHWWQSKAGRIADELEKTISFDAVFHITFASYWMRVGVASVEKPLLLGPVGGGVEAPLGLLSELGWRGVLAEFFRSVGRRSLFRLPSVRLAAKKAAAIFVNNPETAHRVRRGTKAPITILPNPTAVRVPATLPPDRIPTRDIAFVGRLIPWKGAHLAIRVMRYVKARDARLVIFGDGPDKRRLERRIAKWRLGDRVVLVGEIARTDLLDRLSRCGALIHPALHEEGGNAVAEALAMEVPVVCLNRGGPPLTLKLFPQFGSVAITPTTPSRTARDMAAVLDRILVRSEPRGEQTHRASLSFGREILAALDAMTDTR